MNTLLRVDASSRVTGSQSRALGDFFENAWLKRYPGDQIMRRDLASDVLPHISSQTITAFYTPGDQITGDLRGATALSDRLIAELRAADVLLLTTPIYNFSVPSALKAWIDQVSRIGHTFSYDGKSFAGLLTGKRAYVACAYGAAGYLGNGPLTAYDFLKPYLTVLLNFLGVQDVRFFGVEATALDKATVADNMTNAEAEILRVISVA